MKCEEAKTLLLFTFTSVPAPAQHDQHRTNEPKYHDEPGATAKAAQRVGDPYAIDTCPITGKKLGSLSDPVVKLYVGREVRFCCSACPEKFGGWPAHEFGTLGGTSMKREVNRASPRIAAIG